MQIASTSQLKQWMDDKEDMAIIDVLPEDSFKMRHIPGAVNIPMKDNIHFVQDVVEHVALKNQRIVVYCRNPLCDLSKKAAQMLTEAGYISVWVYENGVEGWFGNTGHRAA